MLEVHYLSIYLFIYLFILFIYYYYKGLSSTLLKTQFCQAANQMLSVPSSQLCVPLASGGDPTYAFNVKLSGEEVHGTSQSINYEPSLVLVHLFH